MPKEKVKPLGGEREAEYTELKEEEVINAATACLQSSEDTESESKTEEKAEGKQAEAQRNAQNLTLIRMQRRKPNLWKVSQRLSKRSQKKKLLM